MILTDDEIQNRIEYGDILVKPFNLKDLGSNSIDLHLSEHVAEYVPTYKAVDVEFSNYLGGVYTDRAQMAQAVYLLDAAKENEIFRYTIDADGLVLHPGRLYLMSTLEYTESRNVVPYVEGKSSTGRLGIRIHATAGKGDVGFCGHWTLELDVVLPVRVYKGMPIAQITYFEISGKCNKPYNLKSDAKYNNTDALPQGSGMWKNLVK